MSDTNNRCLKRKHKDMNDENDPLPPGLLQTIENMFLSSEARLEARFNQTEAQFDRLEALLSHVKTTVEEQSAISTSTLTTLEATHRDVRHISYPLDGANGIADCVIDSGGHAVLSTSKKCVYTWVKYPEQPKPLIVGAAHCALTIRTHKLKIGSNSVELCFHICGAPIVDP
jgi:hypothetical protein